MSITSVSSKIRAAVQNSYVSETEAKGIVAEAEKGTVTVGEARVIKELFEKGQPRATPPGMMHTMAIPENPGDVTLAAGAKNVLNAFFSRHDVPAGDNLKKYIAKIETRIAGDRGERLAEAPEEKILSKLHVVRLPMGNAAGAPPKTAYLDTKKDELYLCIGVGLGAPPGQKAAWYGPLKLDNEPARTDISPERADTLREVFQKANQAGALDWQNGTAMRLGVRFVQVELMRERHPDGYKYTALVPVGALTPTAPKADPNEVKEFFVERTGGIGGLSSYVGPLKVKAGASSI